MLEKKIINDINQKNSMYISLKLVLKIVVIR